MRQHHGGAAPVLGGGWRVVDLTIPITDGMDAYPGEPTARFRPFSTVEDTGIAMSDVMIFSQLGTHFDAPAHFIAGGATSEAVELADCIGPAAVVDASGRASLDTELFRARERDITATQRVVVNSGWPGRAGSGGYWSGFPELTTEAARLLCSWGVRFLGLDTPTPSLSALHDIHQILLGHGVVVVECLTRVAALSAVTTVLCLPLPLVGLDGAPVRIVALEPFTQERATT